MLASDNLTNAAVSTLLDQGSDATTSTSEEGSLTAKLAASVNYLAVYATVDTYVYQTASAAGGAAAPLFIVPAGSFRVLPWKSRALFYKTLTSSGALYWEGWN